MNVQEYKLNDVMVCAFKDDITAHNSPEVRRFLDGLLKKQEKKIVVNFSGMSYIDSSGLATFIEMYQRLKKIGGQVRLCGMEGKVQNIFEVTKLNTLFGIYDTQEAALKDF